MFESIFSLRTLWWLMLLLYIPSCIGLIVIVLLQKGKGSGFAGAFGIGPGSEAVFGPRASKSLPVRMTYIMAGIFLTFAFLLSFITGSMDQGIAPEKEDLEAALEQTDTTSGLTDLGLGTGTDAEGEAVEISVEPDSADTNPAVPEDAQPAPEATEEAEVTGDTDFDQDAAPAEDASDAPDTEAPADPS